jgi:hypothetical protein
MSLPNYIQMEDLEIRLKDAIYFSHYDIPLGIRREDENWCWFVNLPVFNGIVIEAKLFKIRLNENQLKSVKELLKKYCNKNNIAFEPMESL